MNQNPGLVRHHDVTTINYPRLTPSSRVWVNPHRKPYRDNRKWYWKIPLLSTIFPARNLHFKWISQLATFWEVDQVPLNPMKSQFLLLKSPFTCILPIVSCETALIQPGNPHVLSTASSAVLPFQQRSTDLNPREGQALISKVETWGLQKRLDEHRIHIIIYIYIYIISYHIISYYIIL